MLASRKEIYVKIWMRLMIRGNVEGVQFNKLMVDNRTKIVEIPHAHRTINIRTMQGKWLKTTTFLSMKLMSKGLFNHHSIWLNSSDCDKESPTWHR